MRWRIPKINKFLPKHKGIENIKFLSYLPELNLFSF
jgi:hypothetical protein